MCQPTGNTCGHVEHNWHCPAHYRPAVEAALRELREECAAMAKEGMRVQQQMNRVAIEISEGDPDFSLSATVDIADRIRRLGEPLAQDPIDKAPK